MQNGVNLGTKLLGKIQNSIIFIFIFPFSVEQMIKINDIELKMESLRSIQPHIATYIQDMDNLYTLGDWSALKDLALSCQILTIRQIESYKRLVRILTSKNVIKQVQLNLESSKYNLSKLQTITQHAIQLKKKTSSFAL